MTIGYDSEIDDDADLDSEFEDYSDTALIYDSDVDWTTEEVVTTSQSFVPNLHAQAHHKFHCPYQMSSHMETILTWNHLVKQMTTSLMTTWTMIMMAQTRLITIQTMSLTLLQ